MRCCCSGLRRVSGSLASQRRKDITPEIRPDFSAARARPLTLLGLIIGFSFSMATARYDLRRSYEAAEAAAIGTVDQRADLVPPANAVEIRRPLRRYTDLRIEFFRAGREDEIQKIDAEVATLQKRMWELASRPRDRAAELSDCAGGDRDEQTFLPPKATRRRPCAAVSRRWPGACCSPSRCSSMRCWGTEPGR